MVYLIHHSFLALNLSVFFDGVDIVALGQVALVVLGTSSTDVEFGAVSSVCPALALVVGAGLVDSHGIEDMLICG